MEYPLFKDLGTSQWNLIKTPTNSIRQMALSSYTENAQGLFENVVSSHFKQSTFKKQIEVETFVVYCLLPYK